MTALVVVIAILAGLLSAETLSRSIRGSGWSARRFATMRKELERFHKADDDDARQAHLIAGGTAMLVLSLAVLAFLALLAAVYAAPMLLLDWNASQSTLYVAISGVSAVAWWILRRRRP